MKIKFLIFVLQKLNYKVNETQTMPSGFSCNGAQVSEVTAFWLDTHILLPPSLDDMVYKYLDHSLWFTLIKVRMKIHVLF